MLGMSMGAAEAMGKLPPDVQSVVADWQARLGDAPGSPLARRFQEIFDGPVLNGSTIGSLSVHRWAHVAEYILPLWGLARLLWRTEWHPRQCVAATTDSAPVSHCAAWRLETSKQFFRYRHHHHHRGQVGPRAHDPAFSDD
jgi:hypothetical protein